MALADQTFGFFIPTVSLMGVGSSKETGEQARALGATNLLIVTDAGLAKLGLADTIKGYVEEAGLKAVIFDGAEPNPTDKNVHDGVKVYQDNKCDGIISLGGSSHDCGKVSAWSSATAAISAISKGSTRAPGRCLHSSPSTPPPAPLRR